MKDYKNRIKILFLSHSSNMYGAENSLLLFLQKTDKKCIEPIVAFPESGILKDKVVDLGIRAYTIKSPWWVRCETDNIASMLYRVISEIRALWRLSSIIRQQNIDVVYTNTIVNFTGALAACINKKPHIWHIREILHGNPNLYSFIPHKLLFKFILKMSQKVIVNSNATAQQFQALNQHNKIQVVYNSVDFDQFTTSTPFPRIEGVTRQSWLVAMVASLQERKAQDIAIRAVKIAREKIPNIKLLLIGEGFESYTRYLKKMVLELDISKNVIFLGYRDDVMKILPYCKVLLAPSQVESFGRSAIEAMAAGIPVIATNTGGLKEIVKNNNTGYLVSLGAYSQVAGKIVELYCHPDKAEKMGEAGRKLARKMFDAERNSQDIEKIIQEVASIV